MNIKEDEMRARQVGFLLKAAAQEGYTGDDLALGVARVAARIDVEATFALIAYADAFQTVAQRNRLLEEEVAELRAFVKSEVSNET